MKKKTQYSIFATLRFVDKLGRGGFELRHARDFLQREPEAELPERVTLGESDLGGIRAIAAAPALALPKAA
jgi:hypothetical protein